MEAQSNRYIYPSRMQITRAGHDVKAAPSGISNQPFLCQPLLEAQTDGAMTAMCLFMGPGTRPYWHTHPHGQLLYVLEGKGLVQREGGDIEEVSKGDCIWFAPDEPHWHGACPDNAFSYICIQQNSGTRSVQWLPTSETQSLPVCQEPR